MGSVLINQQLNPRIAQQLADATNPVWCTSPRVKVSDLVSVQGGNFVMNPHGVKAMGGSTNVYGAGVRQAIYAIFDLILGEFESFRPGRYERVVDTQKAFDTHAALYEFTQGKGWECSKHMGDGFVPMDLPQDGDAIEIMRLKFEWLDLIIRGAYVEIAVEGYATEFYNYLGSLMTMNEEQVRSTILKHKRDAEARRKAWKTSQISTVAIPETIIIDGRNVALNSIGSIKKIFASDGDTKFSAGTEGDKAIKHLAFLAANGYTLTTH
jgi:hypothetical protein